MIAFYFVLSFFTSVNGVAQLNTCHSSVCLSQTVQYQCTVDGQGTFSLRWRIRNSAGSQIDTESYTVGDQLGTDVLATDFTTNFISNTNPLISNISFTAQSHLNNYVIQCELLGGTPVNCTIVIEGPPTVINSMTFTANNFTSVTVSWSLPSVQQCLTNYQLVITNTSSNQQETINTTSTASTYMIVGRTRGIEYCYTVSAVDTANRIGPQSNRNCFTLDTPLQPNITNVEYCDSVLIEWIQPPVSSRPPVLAYIIIHNISTTGNVTTTVLAPTTSTDITELVAGTRFIEVLATNTLGIGLPTQTVIVIPTSDVPTTSVVNSFITSTVSSSTATTIPTLDCTSPIAVSVTVTFILTAIVSSILTLVLTLVLTSIYWKRQLVSNKPSDKPVVVYDTVVHTTSDINSPVSLTNNPAYGPITTQ